MPANTQKLQVMGTSGVLKPGGEYFCDRGTVSLQSGTVMF